MRRISRDSFPEGGRADRRRGAAAKRSGKGEGSTPISMLKGGFVSTEKRGRDIGRRGGILFTSRRERRGREKI